MIFDSDNIFSSHLSSPSSSALALSRWASDDSCGSSVTLSYPLSSHFWPLSCHITAPITPTHTLTRHHSPDFLSFIMLEEFFGIFFLFFLCSMEMTLLSTQSVFYKVTRFCTSACESLLSCHFLCNKLIRYQVYQSLWHGVFFPSLLAFLFSFSRVMRQNSVPA